MQDTLLSLNIGLLRQTFSYIRCRLNYFNLTLLSPFRASENRRPLLFSGNVRCQVDFRNQPHGAAPGSKPGSSRKAFSAGIRQLQEYRISNNLHFPHSDIQYCSDKPLPPERRFFMEPISSLQAEEARLRSKLANNPFFSSASNLFQFLRWMLISTLTGLVVCQHYI